MVGCRVGAKNTLRKNYLALAENLGVEIRPMRTVTRLGVVPGTDGERPLHRVLHERTGPVPGRDRQVVTARHVVLAAGAWGTQTLLHAMKSEGELPRLSDYLGHRTRTNSEALLGAMAQHVPSGDLDLTKGVAITSSFHVDETTHVENCRYGKGSNAMGLLGDRRRARRHRAAAVGRAAAQGGPRPDGLPAADADPAEVERADGHRPRHAEPRQLAARDGPAAGCSGGPG